MVQGQVFLKWVGVGGEAVSFFQGLSVLHFGIILLSANFCYTFEEKLVRRKAGNFNKKRLNKGAFLITKFLRRTILMNICERLLLYIHS